jgi:hypothetical protein
MNRDDMTGHKRFKGYPLEFLRSIEPGECHNRYGYWPSSLTYIIKANGVWYRNREFKLLNEFPRLDCHSLSEYTDESPGCKGSILIVWGPRKDDCTRGCHAHYNPNNSKGTRFECGSIFAVPCTGLKGRPVVDKGNQLWMHISHIDLLENRKHYNMSYGGSHER